MDAAQARSPTAGDRLRDLVLGTPMAWCVVAAWLCFALYLSASNPVVLLSDMFGFIERARQLAVTRADTWVNGLYPFGYPLVLRLLFRVTGDYEQAGRVVSIAAGACSLLALHQIGRLAYSRSVALLGLLACATNPLFVLWSVNTGTDMPAAACMLAAVMFGARADRGDRLAAGDLAAAGLCLGLGYLFRYTTLLAVPPFLVWMVIRPRDATIRESPGQTASRAAAFLLGFLAVSSPQLLVSAWVTGNPLWNEQGANVYFGMFGGMNWGTGWQEAMKHPSVFRVVADHPLAFAAHFLRNLVTVPLHVSVQYPLGFLAGAGMVLSLSRRLAPTTVVYSRRMLVLLVATAFACGVCIAFCLPRFLLGVAIVASLAAAFGFEQVVPRTAEIVGGRTVPVRGPLLAAVLVLLAWRHVVGPVLHPVMPGAHSIVETAATIRLDGNTDPHRVLALGYAYYDVPSPTKDPYSTAWFDPESLGAYATVDGIVREMRTRGFRYLVFDDDSPRLVSWAEGRWPVPREEWERHFITLSPAGARATVLKLRDD